jgi:hypothetical protein
MDEYFKRISDFDQASAGMQTIAKVLGVYFKYLRQAKFTRDESLKLVLSYQKIILQKGMNLAQNEDQTKKEDDDGNLTD